MQHSRRISAVTLAVAAAGITTGLATHDLGHDIPTPASVAAVRATVPATTAPATTTTFDLRRLAPVVADAIKFAERASAKAPSRPHRPPTPHPSATSGGRCPYADIIRSVWTTDADWALQIVWRESRCQPDAQNRTSSAAGLFQIVRGSWHDPGGCPWSARYNPVCNARAARRLYELAGGRSPWRL